MFGAQLRCSTCNGYKPDRCICGKDPALKGVKGGNCNRQACQKPFATWYNKGTYKYYCQDCATLINMDPRSDGSLLCTDEAAKYRVTANWDAIQRLPDEAAHDLNWVVERLDIPNRVSCHFSDRIAAQNIYTKLQALNVHVFRNWMD